MPLWIIYHPSNILEDDETRAKFAKDITGIYTGIGLPAFYVVVNFIKLDVRDTYVGAKTCVDTPFVRISIEHIAVTLEDSDDVYRKTSAHINDVIKKNVQPLGAEWEFHVNETERRLWMVKGLVAPPFGSEAEKQWAKQNAATPWE